MPSGPENRRSPPVRLDARRTGHLLAVPPFALAVLRLLRRAGHRAWVCGGTARDLLAGRVPVDQDLTTTAGPETLRRLLPAAWVGPEQPGEAWGSLLLTCGGVEVELTSLRSEGRYSDRRKPDDVRFTDSLYEDHRRRDFTVNALYLDPFDAVVEDPCGGQADLAAGRLRCVGEPVARLAEDSLRILRGLRLCAEHGWVPDRLTWAALVACAPSVAGLSGTRILDELGRLFVAPGRARGLGLLVASGAAAAVLPALPPLADVPQPATFHPEGDVLRHTALVLANLRPPVDPRLAWAAVFHDVGKKECLTFGPDRIRFDGHDTASAGHARAWLEERGAAAALVADVVEIVREHIRIAAVPSFRPAKRNRFLAGRLFPLHLEFHRADCLASHAGLERFRELSGLWQALPPDLPEPLLRGRDLVALGIPPGPAIGRLLAAVEDARLAGDVRTAAEARRFVDELRRRGSG